MCQLGGGGVCEHGGVSTENMPKGTSSLFEQISPIRKRRRNEGMCQCSTVSKKQGFSCMLRRPHTKVVSRTGVQFQVKCSGLRAHKAESLGLSEP